MLCIYALYTHVTIRKNPVSQHLSVGLQIQASDIIPTEFIHGKSIQHSNEIHTAEYRQ